MRNEQSITKTLEQWKQGELDINGLWYDWFCKSSSLENRGKRLLQKLKAIQKSPKFDPDKTYVFFKNNCPCVGRLYDDFRICDMENGDVIYTVVPSSGHNSNLGEAEIWGKENDFKEPLFEGTWREAKKWFLK